MIGMDIKPLINPLGGEWELVEFPHYIANKSDLQEMLQLLKDKENLFDPRNSVLPMLFSVIELNATPDGELTDKYFVLEHGFSPKNFGVPGEEIGIRATVVESDYDRSGEVNLERHELTLEDLSRGWKYVEPRRHARLI